jgi:hypothetical protein
MVNHPDLANLKDTSNGNCCIHIAAQNGQGLTLVHFSAQRKHILCDKLGA